MAWPYLHLAGQDFAEGLCIANLLSAPSVQWHNSNLSLHPHQEGGLGGVNSHAPPEGSLIVDLPLGNTNRCVHPVFLGAQEIGGHETHTGPVHPEWPHCTEAFSHADGQTASGVHPARRLNDIYPDRAINTAASHELNKNSLWFTHLLQMCGGGAGLAQGRRRENLYLHRRLADSQRVQAAYTNSALQLSQQMPYLGLLLNSHTMTARLSEELWKRYYS